MPFFGGMSYMIGKFSISAIVFVLSAGTFITFAQTRPPPVFIDRKICPGEGCYYTGKARAVDRIKVYLAPSLTAARSFTLPLGTMITGIDSQVHTRAGRFRIKRNHGKYRRGEVLSVYTYLGEGFFKIWHRGKMTEEDLAFSVWGGSTGTRCDQDPKICWGILEKETDMKWWLKIRTNNNRTGWILVEKNLHWLEPDSM